MRNVVEYAGHECAFGFRKGEYDAVLPLLNGFGESFSARFGVFEQREDVVVEDAVYTIGNGGSRALKFAKSRLVGVRRKSAVGESVLRGVPRGSVFAVEAKVFGSNAETPLEGVERGEPLGIFEVGFEVRARDC